VPSLFSMDDSSDDAAAGFRPAFLS
jgi:hypothetical protein